MLCVTAAAAFSPSIIIDSPCKISRADIFSAQIGKSARCSFSYIPTWNTYLFFCLTNFGLLRVSNVLVFVCESVCVDLQLLV